jgi:hypothetical protein
LPTPPEPTKSIKINSVEKYHKIDILLFGYGIAPPDDPVLSGPLTAENFLNYAEDRGLDSLVALKALQEAKRSGLIYRDSK